MAKLSWLLLTNKERKNEEKKMRIGLHAADWKEITKRDRNVNKNGYSYGLLTRMLIRDAPVPWKRVHVDVDSDVDRTWLRATVRYLRNLTGVDLLTVYAYTTPVFEIVLDLARGGTMYTEMGIPETLDANAMRLGGVLVFKSDRKRGTGALRATLGTKLGARVEAHLRAEDAIKGVINAGAPSIAEEAAWEAEVAAMWDAWDEKAGSLVAAALSRGRMNLRDSAAPSAPSASTSSLGSRSSASFARRARDAFVRDRWQWDCLFAHAARALGPSHLRVDPDRAARVLGARSPWHRFRRAYPHVTAQGWWAILERYTADLDSVFARAPPLRAPMVVFRGIKRGKDEAHCDLSPRYVSTTMRRAVAAHFTDASDPLVLEITAPRGARPLAMLAISRYEAEAELLFRKSEALGVA